MNDQDRIDAFVGQRQAADHELMLTGLKMGVVGGLVSALVDARRGEPDEVMPTALPPHRTIDDAEPIYVPRERSAVAPRGRTHRNNLLILALILGGGWLVNHAILLLIASIALFLLWIVGE